MDFLAKHSDKIHGILDGFDRLMFRGIYQKLYYGKGAYSYMKEARVMLWDLEKHLKSESKLIHQHLDELAKQSNATFRYINNSYENKSEIAKKDLENHPTKKGLISVIRVLEVASSFSLRGSVKKKKIEIKRELRKHLHYYLYIMDEEFGWIHVKIQGRLPYAIQVYVNGREHLKIALKKEKIRYRAHENSITWVKDIDRAQALADELIIKKWDRLLNAFARRVNPLISKIEPLIGESYRWFMHQVEFASDVLFKNEDTLDKLYPELVQYATMFRGGEDVYTFFGRTLQKASKKGVKGSVKKYTQGFRVKHYLDRNSIKMYTKGSVLRIEITINNSGSFRIFKDTIKNGCPIRVKGPMGKAVSNLYRYAQVAQEGNLKYLNALAVIDPPNDQLIQGVQMISERTRVSKKDRGDRFFPALNLLKEQTGLILEAISNGKFCIKSFSNKNLREALTNVTGFTLDKTDPKASKKLSAKVTRLIAKLIAHKIIQRIDRTFKYYLTDFGTNVCYQIMLFKKVQLSKA